MNSAKTGIEHKGKETRKKYKDMKNSVQEEKN
jgi:hypothetical protein